MPVLLVIGGSGLLGSKLAAKGLERYDVVATYRSVRPGIEGVEWRELHKERKDQAVSVLKEVRPDFVADTAAFHNVDKCEEERDLAWQVNVTGTHALARQAAELRARYLYVSTDFVFDGAAGPYSEEDSPAPMNYYGVTKLAAEKVVLSMDDTNQVVRPSVVYGWDKTRLNFATWVLTSLRDKREIKVVTDWVGCPTLADSLAEAILQLLTKRLTGTFHLAGPDCMSRFDFALGLARGFGLDERLVLPVTSTELGMKAPRPPNSCLVNKRASREGITVVSAEEGIRRMKEERDLESFETPARFKS